MFTLATGSLASLPELLYSSSHPICQLHILVISGPCTCSCLCDPTGEAAYAPAGASSSNKPRRPYKSSRRRIGRWRRSTYKYFRFWKQGKARQLRDSGRSPGGMWADRARGRDINSTAVHFSLITSLNLGQLLSKSSQLLSVSWASH